MDAVNLLARRCHDRLMLKSSGWMPSDEEGWKLLCMAEEIIAARQPRQFCPPGFQATTTYHELHDRTMILYNMDAEEKIRCEYICHELFEYLAELEFNSLFAHQDPPWLDLSPRDLFHAVGERAVEVFCRRSPKLRTINEMVGAGIVQKASEVAPRMYPPQLCYPHRPARPLPPVTSVPNRLHWPTRSARCSCGCQEGLGSND